jgi:hypothetical protein
LFSDRVGKIVKVEPKEETLQALQEAETSGRVLVHDVTLQHATRCPNPDQPQRRCDPWTRGLSQTSSFRPDLQTPGVIDSLIDKVSGFFKFVVLWL